MRKHHEHTRSESQAQDDAGREHAWRERHERGEFGSFGNYGGSDDQWDIERNPPAAGKAAIARYGVLPQARGDAGARKLEPGYTPFNDAEPYRSERIYGNQGEIQAEYTVHADALVHEADARYEQRHPEAWGASLSDQFGGSDAVVGTSREAGPRSDIRIHEEVCERLSTSKAIDLSNVSVRVASGVVSLEGSVPDQGMKHAIWNIAAHCAGVVEVENHIRVGHGAGDDSRAGGLAVAADDSRLLNGRQT